MKSTFKLLSILGVAFGSFLAENVDLTVEQQQYINQIISDSQDCQKSNSQVSTVVMVTHDNYQQEVVESTLPVLILVSANWCPPCQIFKPIFYDVAESFVGIFKFVNIDFDSFPEFVKGQEVDSVPMLMLCHKGQILERAPGFMTKNDFVNCLNFVAENIRKQN